MQTIAGSGGSVVALVPGGMSSLAHLSDSEVLEGTRRLVGRSNQLLAALLVHLAEVEARGLHRKRACSGVYTYCIYELRFSEDEAARRAAATKLVRKIPALFDAIANGELHLTGVLMLGPHLTMENHVEVLARAKFRTKKEIAKLVRELAPLPAVADLMEPLGPQAKALRNPTWQEFVASLCPTVRELPPGERPQDWANDGVAPDGLATPIGQEGRLAFGLRADVVEPDTAPARVDSDEMTAAPARVDIDEMTAAPARVDSGEMTAARARVDSGEVTAAPARAETSGALAGRFRPLQYQMQFTTTEEHAQLVERAKALMARENRGVSLGELHLQGMRLLVAELEKAKFAVTQRARKRGVSVKGREAEVLHGIREERVLDELARHERAGAQQETGEQESGAQKVADEQAGDEQAGDEQAGDEQAGDQRATEERTTGEGGGRRPRTRHVPAEERRAVFARDCGRCTYVDERGARCRETSWLELHHLVAFARGGVNVAANLTLRCHAHNALAAEEEFGRGSIARRRNSARHESMRAACSASSGRARG